MASYCQFAPSLIARLVRRGALAEWSEAWVLNPKMLGAYIEREPVGLKVEDVAVVASRIVKDTQKS